MECSFKEGDKVVCIDNNPGYGKPTPCPFKINGIYTVKDFCLPDEDSYKKDSIVLHCSLVGYTGGYNYYWSVKRFKPFVERPKTTDISIFKKMLRPIEPAIVKEMVMKNGGHHGV